MNNYCKNIISKEIIDIFHFPARVYISGYSHSGKTQLCINLLKKYLDKFEKILICDSPNNSEYISEKKIKEKIEILDYIPNISEIKINYQGKSIILIFDDNYSTTFNSKNVLEFFTQGRHLQINIILLSQNLFSRGKYQRDITLNVSHFIITKIRDKSQLQILSRQIFGKENFNKLMFIYDHVHNESKWGHILIDLSATSTKDIEIRSNIIANNENYDFEMCYNFIK